MFKQGLLLKNLKTFGSLDIYCVIIKLDIVFSFIYLEVTTILNKVIYLPPQLMSQASLARNFNSPALKVITLT